MKRMLLSHTVIAAALLGFGLAANADEKMKSDASSGSGAATTQPSGDTGAAGRTGDAAKDCPPGAAGRTGQETSDRTPEPTKASPPGAVDEKGTAGQGGFTAEERPGGASSSGSQTK
jgi:hypothetical protein